MIKILDERKKQQERLMKMEEEKELVIKPLKKKIQPKKVVHDAQGDWEVVDQKKSVYVEDNDGKDSLSD